MAEAQPNTRELPYVAAITDGRRADLATEPRANVLGDRLCLGTLISKIDPAGNMGLLGNADHNEQPCRDTEPASAEALNGSTQAD